MSTPSWSSPSASSNSDLLLLQHRHRHSVFIFHIQHLRTLRQHDFTIQTIPRLDAKVLTAKNGVSTQHQQLIFSIISPGLRIPPTALISLTALLIYIVHGDGVHQGSPQRRNKMVEFSWHCTEYGTGSMGIQVFRYGLVEIQYNLSTDSHYSSFELCDTRFARIQTKENIALPEPLPVLLKKEVTASSPASCATY